MRLNRQIFSVLSLGGVVLLGARPAHAAAAPMEDAPHHYLKALLHETQGNLAAAQEELQAAVKLSPKSAYLFRETAEFDFRLGELKKAEQDVEKAIEINPQSVRALILAGQIYWADGEAEKAEEKLRQAVKLSPDDSDAVVNLAGAVTPKNPHEAIRLYNDYLVRHPGSVDMQEHVAQLYQSIGDTDSAKRSWDDSDRRALLS